MEAFFNKEKNQYIFAAYRCGTNFLSSKQVKNIGWDKLEIPVSDIELTHETSVVKVIRDPFERWSSWFNNFVIHNDHTQWPIKQANEWLKNFEKTFANDSHTEKQSVMYNFENIVTSNSFYVNMKDLNLFLNISNEKHKSSHHENFHRFSNDVLSLFNTKIKTIYHDDYTWIKNLPILTF